MTISNLTNRRALTLVEMLVGMAITLVMMAAVVNLFANISEGVRNRRATMEVAANLRIARTRLYNDLAGATCLKYPKDAFGVMPQPDVNNPPDGYFEIVEGQYSDENPPVLPASERATSLLPSSNRLYNDKGEPIDPNEITDGGGRGDYDDILAMTVESESERFRGRGRGLEPGGNPSITTGGTQGTGAWVDMAISSPVAEVIWYSIETPLRTDPSYEPEMGEPGMRRIYRRTLLVAPWYGTATNQTLGTSGSDPLLDLSNTTLYPTYASKLAALREFQERYDISVRLEGDRLVPNTLADLSRRENRFAHAPNDSVTPANTFPHQFPYNVNAPANYVQPHLNPDPDDPTTNVGSLRRLGSERENEDLVLDNVLAFDVQVFDPGAPLYNLNGTIIPPSGSDAFTTASGGSSNNITGFGSYVDLGWNQAGTYNYTSILTNIPTAPAPLFQQERRLGWHPTFPGQLLGSAVGIPAVYDTWSTYYESDQVNQEQVPFYSLPQSSITWLAWQTGIIDQGTNGLDENNINGPDDPLERETSPPYPYALRGVQVKLRIYEPESRQIRETTVTRNLVK